MSSCDHCLDRCKMPISPPPPVYISHLHLPYMGIFTGNLRDFSGPQLNKFELVYEVFLHRTPGSYLLSRGPWLLLRNIYINPQSFPALQNACYVIITVDHPSTSTIQFKLVHSGITTSYGPALLLSPYRDPHTPDMFKLIKLGLIIQGPPPLGTDRKAAGWHSTEIPSCFTYRSLRFIPGNHVAIFFICGAPYCGAICGQVFQETSFTKPVATRRLYRMPHYPETYRTPPSVYVSLELQLMFTVVAAGVSRTRLSI